MLEAVWTPGPVRTGAESLAPTAISFCIIFYFARPSSVLLSLFWLACILPFCLYLQHTTLTSMPPAGSEPTILAGEGPQTYALERSATVIGRDSIPGPSSLSRVAVTALINRGLEETRPSGISNNNRRFEDEATTFFRNVLNCLPVHTVYTSRHTWIFSYTAMIPWNLAGTFALEISVVLMTVKKGKGFPLQAWCGFWGSRRLRLLDRLDIRHD
jgi:hypothetical protein